MSELTEIKLGNLGKFMQRHASFLIKTPNLPRPWDYLYINNATLLRINNDGTGYLQLDPPAGPALFKMERLEKSPPAFLVWFSTEPSPRGATRCFTNFGTPVVPHTSHPELQSYSLEYHPENAVWDFIIDRWRVKTTVVLPPSLEGMTMRVEVVNLASESRRLDIIPSCRPHLASFAMAPWDVPHLYQRCAVTEARGRNPAPVRNGNVVPAALNVSPAVPFR